MNRPKQTPSDSYSFHVEINVSASSKGAALVQLRHVLSNSDFADYKIINAVDEGAPVSTNDASATDASTNPVAEVKKKAKEIPQAGLLDGRIRQYIEENKLIRLNVNKGRGVKMSIPCRVINFDSSSQLLTVYHVDEKQVYSVVLNEIDDFVD